MKPGATDTLFYPVTEEILSPPQRGLFLNAQLPQASGVKNADWFAALIHQQGNRASWLDLQKAGITALRDLTEIDDTFDTVFIRATNHRRENEAMIAEAANHVTANGTILIAGAKTDGIASLKKRLAGLGCDVESMSKHHAQVLILKPHADLSLLAHAPQTIEGGFETAPGMFSADHADQGSQLLAQHLPSLAGKRVADFGAGWGYLAAQVASKGLPEKLELFEAHWPSLQAAGRNLEHLHPDCPLALHWHDLAREPVERRFDAIIMNPPFHTGRETRRSLGEAFIRSASNTLVPHGSLYMVANTGLNYEPLLEKSFTRHEEITRQGGFKIIYARR